MPEPMPYTLNEICRDVLPVLPTDWQVGEWDINEASVAAAYWLLARLWVDDLRQREWPYVQGRIEVEELLEATGKLSSSQRVLALYAIDLAEPGYAANAGCDIPGPGTVARLLNHRQSETLEAAMAMANGRRHQMTSRHLEPEMAQ